MPTDKPRFSVTVPEALYNRVQDYQFTHRMKNQTQAILALITRGLELEEGLEPEKAQSLDTITERCNRMDESDRKTLEFISGLLLTQDKYKK